MIGAGDLRGQWTIETFYTYQVSQVLAVTFDVQVIGYPAFNATEGAIGIYGFRVRTAFE